MIGIKHTKFQKADTLLFAIHIIYIILNLILKFKFSSRNCSVFNFKTVYFKSS